MDTVNQQNMINWQDLKKVIIADFSGPVLAVCLVNGEAIRGQNGAGIDPNFQQVCNSINCSWMQNYLSVSPYEIWVDINTNLSELDKVLIGNVTETGLIMEGMDAGPAHEMATIAEQHARANPDKAPGMLFNALSKLNDMLAGLLLKRMETEAGETPELAARCPSDAQKLRDDIVTVSWPKLLSNLDTIDTMLLDTISISTPTAIKLNDKAPATSRIQIMRTGTFYHRVYGKFTITAKDLKSMLDNFAAHPKAPTKMVVDYEHMSSSEPAVIAPAAGWVKGLEIEDNKLYAIVEWTPTAVTQIQAKEYQYISPEFTLKYKDKETNKNIGPTLLSVALTNRPFIEGMDPVALTEKVAEGAVMLSEGLNKPVQARDLAEITAAEAMQLVGVENIQVTNTKKEVSVMEIAEQELASLKAKAAKADDLEAKLQLTEKRATDAEGVIAARDAETAVNAAIAARKILPAQKDWAQAYALKDKPGFEAFVAAAPVIGPALGEQQPGTQVPGKENKETDTLSLTEAEEKVGRIMAKTINMPYDKYALKLKEAKEKAIK